LVSIKIKKIKKKNMISK